MQIEEGKFYRNRLGEKIGPMRRAGLYTTFCWISPEGSSFTEYGIYLCTMQESNFDLVEEWREKESSEETNVDACHPKPSLDPITGLSQILYGDSGKPPATFEHASVPGYEMLADVLQSAHDQAAKGKGKARHNSRDVPFANQPIMEIGRMCGLGYPTGQAQKKTQEAVGMFNRGENDRAEVELLGAINYLAAAILLIRETAKKIIPPTS